MIFSTRPLIGWFGRKHNLIGWIKHHQLKWKPVIRLIPIWFQAKHWIRNLNTNYNLFWRLIWEKEERLGLRRWLISTLWNFKTCPKLGNGHAHNNFKTYSHMYSWGWRRVVGLSHIEPDQDFFGLTLFSDNSSVGSEPWYLSWFGSHDSVKIK